MIGDKGLTILETRPGNPIYFEVVFPLHEYADWRALMLDVFGPPAKDAGTRPTAQHTAVTRLFGGIYTGQTLFLKEFDETKMLAMFWPWQRQANVTLKVGAYR